MMFLSWKDSTGFSSPIPALLRQNGWPSTWGPANCPMALALENRTRVILLDDMLARRTAQAAGLTVWGTLRVLLEAKREGVTDRIAPCLTRLSESGMWLSDDIRQRILALANETTSDM
jgi:predicted nucleic acid-binding protein